MAGFILYILELRIHSLRISHAIFHIMPGEIRRINMNLEGVYPVSWHFPVAPSVQQPGMPEERMWISTYFTAVLTDKRYSYPQPGDKTTTSPIPYRYLNMDILFLWVLPIEITVPHDIRSFCFLNGIAHQIFTYLLLGKLYRPGLFDNHRPG
jgi:hypothetical protein